MTRTTLIIGALIFALAAAGVLVWTGVWEFADSTDLEESKPETPPVAASSSHDSQAAKWIEDAAVAGGIAVTFSGDAQGWFLSEGHKLERFAIDASTVFARLTSSSPLDPVRVVDGLYVELPNEFAIRSNGKRVEVGVVARSAQSNPSTTFSVIYATQQAGNSGWRTMQLSGAFGLSRLVFDVPRVDEGYAAKPVIVIRGDSNGAGLGVELLGAYAKVLEPPPFAVNFSNQSGEWIVPEGHKLTVARTESGEPVGRLVSTRPLNVTETNLGTQGAVIQIPAATIQTLRGREIEVGIVARRASSNSSEALSVIFATQQAGNSGWQTIPLTPEFKPRLIRYKLADPPSGYSQSSIIVLQADATGSGQAAEIQSISVTPID